MDNSSSSLGLALVARWLQISAPSLVGVLPDAGIPMLASFLASLTPGAITVSCWAWPGSFIYCLTEPQPKVPAPSSWHSPGLKPSLSTVYLTPIHTLRSSSNPSSSRQCGLTTLAQHCILLVINLNFEDDILPCRVLYAQTCVFSP